MDRHEYKLEVELNDCLFSKISHLTKRILLLKTEIRKTTR
jgi:hypothetical protein